MQDHTENRTRKYFSTVHDEYKYAFKEDLNSL